MKTSKRIFVITVAVFAVLLILTSPALAGQKTLVCDGAAACQINIMNATPTEYPAGEPFYIQHGAGLAPPEDVPIGVGHNGFALEVDGAYVEPDYVEHIRTTGGDGGEYYIFTVMNYNFLQGLPVGEHTFTGYWYWGCWPKGEWCEHPLDETVYWEETLTVNFVEP